MRIREHAEGIAHQDENILCKTRIMYKYVSFTLEFLCGEPSIKWSMSVGLFCSSNIKVYQKLPTLRKAYFNKKNVFLQKDLLQTVIFIIWYINIILNILTYHLKM